MTEIRAGVIILTKHGGTFHVSFTMYCDSVPREGEYIQHKGKIYKVESVLYVIGDHDNKVTIQVEITDNLKK
jgi:hypothetical protein